MLTTIIIATLLYVIFNFAFTYPWNIVIFKDVYDELAGPISRDEPIIPMGVLAMLLEALAMAIIFDIHFIKDANLLDSLILSHLVGLFSTLYGALVVPAKFKIENKLKYVYLELAHGITQFTGIGIIFSFLF